MPTYDYDEAKRVFYRQTSKTSAGRKLAEGTREIERRRTGGSGSGRNREQKDVKPVEQVEEVEPDEQEQVLVDTLPEDKFKEGIRTIQERKKPVESVVTMSSSEYQDYTRSEKSDADKALFDFYRQRDSIVPSQWYAYTDESGETVYMRGVALREKFYGKDREDELLDWHKDISQKHTDAMKLSYRTDIKFHYHTEGEDKGKVKSYQIIEHWKDTEEYKELKKQDIWGRIATGVSTALTPEDPLGLKTIYHGATGDYEKIFKTKVEAIQRVDYVSKTGGWESVRWYLESPATQIGIAMAGGFAIGKPLAAKMMYAKHVLSPAKFTLLKAGMIGAGGALIAPSVYSIGTDVWENRHAEAFSKGGMLGFQIAGGYAGFKAAQGSVYTWGKHKGLTPAEKGAYEGMKRVLLQRGNISDSPRTQEFLRGMNQKFWTRQQIYRKSIKTELEYGEGGFRRFFNIKKPIIEQPPPDFSQVEVLKGRTWLQRGFEKISTTLGYKKRMQLYGGIAQDRPTTDIDIMTRTPRFEAKLRMWLLKRGVVPDVKKGGIIDAHKWLRQGSIMDMGGGIKGSGVKTSKGLLSAYHEEFSKLSSSSFDLPHSGRAKDILRSVDILKKSFDVRGGIPESYKTSVALYEKIMLREAFDYTVMSPSKSSYLFSDSIGQKFWDVRVKYHMKLGRMTYDQPFSRITGNVPPSSKIGFSPSFIFPSSNIILPSSTLSISSNVYSSSYRPSSIRSSKSYYPSSISPISPSKSYSLSRSYKSPSRSSYSPSSSVISSIVSSPPSSSSRSSSIVPSIVPPFHPRLPKNLGSRGSGGGLGIPRLKGFRYREWKIKSPLRGVKI